MNDHPFDLVARHGDQIAMELNPRGEEPHVAVLLIAFDMKTNAWSLSSNLHASSLLPLVEKLKEHIVSQYEGISAASNERRAQEAKGAS